MPTNHLNEVEIDFIEFISSKKKRDLQTIVSKYLALKEKFDFHSNEFKTLGVNIYELNSLYYTDETDRDLIESYRHHALMHLLRFVSYEQARLERNSLTKKVRTAIKIIKKGDIYSFFKNTRNHVLLKKTHVHDFNKIANDIQESSTTKINTVIDYGCGPGFISFALSKKIKEEEKRTITTYLVDIDTLVLDFTKFRFEKNSLPFEVITIDENNMYPVLPPHDICIATEVLEHVPKPEVVAEHIAKSLQKGGVLYGSMNDHNAHAFHISPDLAKTRDAIKQNGLTQISSMFFSKS